MSAKNWPQWRHNSSESTQHAAIITIKQQVSQKRAVRAVMAQLVIDGLGLTISAWHCPTCLSALTPGSLDAQGESLRDHRGPLRQCSSTKLQPLFHISNVSWE